MKRFCMKNMSTIETLIDLMGTTPLTDYPIWLLILLCCGILLLGEKKINRTADHTLLVDLNIHGSISSTRDAATPDSQA